MGLSQEVHVKASLCSLKVKDHYRACLAAAEVIAKHNLEAELLEQFDKISTLQDGLSDSLDTTFRENRKRFG